jgi:hypothetical protein
MATAASTMPRMSPRCDEDGDDVTVARTAGETADASGGPVGARADGECPPLVATGWPAARVEDTAAGRSWSKVFVASW